MGLTKPIDNARLMPTGAVLPFFRRTAPDGWLKCNRASYSRAEYPKLFEAIGIIGNHEFTADPATNRLTCTAHGFATGAEVDLESVKGCDDGTLPAPLAKGTSYYARAVDVNTITLHPTAADAVANTNVIDITTAGDGAHHVAPIATFMVPEIRGEAIRGVDDGRGVDAGRALGSWQDHAIEEHDHDVTSAYSSSGSGGLIRGGTAPLLAYTTTKTGGSETRMRNVAMLYCIKY